MKNILKVAASALVLTAFANDSFGQATANATATAVIVTPISITKTANMSFGNIAVNAVGGTVDLPSNGSPRVATNGVTLPAIQGTVSTANFTVSGEQNYTYAITLPTSNVVLANGAAQMTINHTSFQSTPSGTGLLSAGGSQALSVGATLIVGGAQAAGTYTTATPFDVTVNYN